MRIAVILILFFLVSSSKAGIPTYSALRNCAEKENPTNSVPAAERVFVIPDYHHDLCPNYQDAFILHYREGITIRQIVDESNFKGTLVQIWVFHKSDNVSAPIFHTTIQPTNNPTFAIKPEDVILISTGPLDI
jgi:hypothetical protein